MEDLYETIKIESKENLFLISLDRPKALNALNDTMMTELEEAFNRAKADKDCRAVVITGQGRAFCAGADIPMLGELDVERGLAFAKRGQKVFDMMASLGKPTIAAVNGFAFGGGCELALAATMRVASENAIFSQPEVRLGIIPGYGGTQRLARIVGTGRAIDACITGRSIVATEALAWGLVSEVIKADKLLTRTGDIARGILDMAPLAVNTAVDIIQQGHDMPLNKALELEAEAFSQMCGTQDKKEGVDAFLNKRKPEFIGA